MMKAQCKEIPRVALLRENNLTRETPYGPYISAALQGQPHINKQINKWLDSTEEMQTLPWLLPLSKQLPRVLFLVFIFINMSSCVLSQALWVSVLVRAHKREKWPEGSDTANRITECYSLLKHQQVCVSPLFLRVENYDRVEQKLCHWRKAILAQVQICSGTRGYTQGI